MDVIREDEGVLEEQQHDRKKVKWTEIKFNRSLLLDLDVVMGRAADTPRWRDEKVVAHLIDNLRPGSWLCSSTMRTNGGNYHNSDALNCFYEVGQVQRFRRNMRSPPPLYTSPEDPRNHHRHVDETGISGRLQLRYHYTPLGVHRRWSTYLNLAEFNMRFMHVRVGQSLLIVFAVWYVNDDVDYPWRWSRRFVFNTVAFTQSSSSQQSHEDADDESNAILVTLAEEEEHILANDDDYDDDSDSDDDDANAQASGIVELVKFLMRSRGTLLTMHQVRSFIRIYYTGYVALFYPLDLPEQVYLPHDSWASLRVRVPKECRAPRTTLDEEREVIRKLSAMRHTNKTLIADMPMYVYETLLGYITPSYHSYYMARKHMMNNETKNEE